MTDTAAPGGYSRAFDNIVQSPDDTVGLLAYALFKQGVRESAAIGRKDETAQRNPPPTVVRVYRDAAQRILEEFASNAIAEATPEVQQSAILSADNGGRTGGQFRFRFRVGGYNII